MADREVEEVAGAEVADAPAVSWEYFWVRPVTWLFKVVTEVSSVLILDSNNFSFGLALAGRGELIGRSSGTGEADTVSVVGVLANAGSVGLSKKIKK